ncbi:MAG TPA: alpha-glucan phosphorylase, partial [Ktedonobacteraceae bacterium]|nr:alpha-glucan phosphorylase [Ktedonobacteraceae bacterium]
IQQGIRIEENHYERARVLAAWKEKVRKAWAGLELYAEGRREGQISLGEGVDMRAWVRADNLRPEDFTIELVYGEARDDQVAIQHTLPMEYIKQELDGSLRYELRLKPPESGNIAYGVRALPNHPALANKHELGLVRWA